MSDLRKKCIRAPENGGLRAHIAKAAKAAEDRGLYCAGCLSWWKRDGVFFIQQEGQHDCPLRDVILAERAAR